jgi:hypothetical protein
MAGGTLSIRLSIREAETFRTILQGLASGGASDMATLEAGVRKASEAFVALTDKQQIADKAAAANADTVRRAALSYDGLKAKLDPVYGALLNHERAVDICNTAVTRLGVSETDANAVKERSLQIYRDLINELSGFNAALSNAERRQADAAASIERAGTSYAALRNQMLPTEGALATLNARLAVCKAAVEGQVTSWADAAIVVGRARAAYAETVAELDGTTAALKRNGDEAAANAAKIERAVAAFRSQQAALDPASGAWAEYNARVATATAAIGHLGVTEEDAARQINLARVALDAKLSSLSFVTTALDQNAAAAAKTVATNAQLAATFDAWRSKVDPLWASEQQLILAETELNAAVTAGLRSKETATVVLAELTAQHRVTANSLEYMANAEELAAEAAAINAAAHQSGIATFQAARASVDPLYAAMIAYNRTVDEVEAAVARGDATQQEANITVAAADARYEQIAATYSRAARAAKEASDAAALAAAREKAVANAYEATKVAVDRNYAALQIKLKQQESITAAVAAGMITEQESIATLEQVTAAYDKATEAQTRHGHTYNRNRTLNAGALQELIVLAHEMAMGSFSRMPGTLMVFAEMTGGLVEKLQALVTWLKTANGIMTMFGLAATGVGIAAVAAHEMHASALNKLQQHLRASREDYVELGKAAQEAAKKAAINVAGLSTSDAKASIALIAAQPNFSATKQSMGDILKIATDLAYVMNQKVPEAAKTLAESLKDPAAVAKKFADEDLLGFNQALAHTIARLQAVGDKSGAAALVLSTIKENTHGAAEPVTKFGEAIEKLAKAFDKLKQSMSWYLDFLGSPLVNVLSIIASGVSSLLSGDFNEEISAAISGASLGGGVVNNVGVLRSDGGTVSSERFVERKQAGLPSDVRAELQAAISAAALRFGLDERFIAYTQATEGVYSGGRWLPSDSSEPALGAMQVKPSTGADVVKKFGLGAGDLSNTTYGTMVGGGYLAEMLERYGNATLALVAFKVGPGTMDKVLAGNTGSLTAAQKEEVISAYKRAERYTGVASNTGQVIDISGGGGATSRDPLAREGKAAGYPGVVNEFVGKIPSLGVFSETTTGLKDTILQAQRAKTALEELQSDGVTPLYATLDGGKETYARVSSALTKLQGDLYKTRDPIETIIHGLEQSASTANVASGATLELAKLDVQLREAARGMGQENASAEQIERAHIARLKELDAEFRRQIDDTDRATANNDRLTASLQAGGAETVHLTNKIRAEEEARKKAKEGSAEYETKVAALTASYDKQSASIANQTTARATLNTNLGTQYIEAEIATLGMDADKRGLVLAALKAEIEAKKTLQKLSPEVANEAVAAAVRQASAQQRLAKETQVNADIATELTSIFSSVGSSISDAFVKGEASGVKFKTILQGIGTQLAEFALKLAILNPLLNTLFSQKLTTIGDATSAAFGSSGSVAPSWGASILSALGLASTAEDKATTSVGGDLISNSGTSLTNGSAIISTTNNTLVTSGSGSSSGSGSQSSTSSSMSTLGSGVGLASSGAKLFGIEMPSMSGIGNAVNTWGMSNLGTGAGLDAAQAAFVSGEVGAANSAGVASSMTGATLTSTVGGFVGGIGGGYLAGTTFGNMLNPGHEDQTQVGAGVGAVGGAIAGFAIGGPVGALIGGVLGGALGGSGGSFFGPGAAHNGWGYQVDSNDGGRLVSSNEHYNAVAKEQWTADMASMAKVNVYLDEKQIQAKGVSLVGGKNTGVAGEKATFQETAQGFRFSTTDDSASLKQVLADREFSSWDDLAAGVAASETFDSLTTTAKSIGSVQTAINSLNTTYDAAVTQCTKYGLSETVLNTKRAEAIKSVNDEAAAKLASERAAMASRVAVANDNDATPLAKSLATAAANAKTEMLSFMGALTAAFGDAYATTAEYADLVAQLTATQVAERQKIIRDFSATQKQGLNNWADALTNRMATATGNTALATSSANASTFRDQIVAATSSLKELGLTAWQASIQIDALMAVQAAEAANAAYTSARSAYEAALNTAITSAEAASSAAITLSTTLRTAAEALTKFAAGLLTSASSPLTPEQKLAAARVAMAASAATAGDTSLDASARAAAASQLQTDASTRLSLAESYYGKAGPGYADEFEAVQKALTAASAAMVDTASPQEQQVKLLGDQLAVLKTQLAELQALGAVAPATLDELKALVAVTYAAKLAADEAAKGATNLAGGSSTAAKAATAAQLVGAQPTTSITQAYQDVLGRAPDAAGLAYWQGQLASGGATLSTIERSLTGSDEYKATATAAVTAIYRAALGRAPDAAGLAHWVAAMQAGASGGEVLRGIQSTTEYRTTHGLQAGGWVGNGTWNRDSVVASYAGGGSIGLAGGEYVVNAAQAARYADMLPGMNAGSYRANDNQAVVVELRAVRAELAALRKGQTAATQVAAQGHLATIQAVQDNTTVAQQAAGSAKRLASR